QVDVVAGRVLGGVLIQFRGGARMLCLVSTSLSLASGRSRGGALAFVGHHSCGLPVTLEATQPLAQSAPARPSPARADLHQRHAARGDELARIVNVQMASQGCDGLPIDQRVLLHRAWQRLDDSKSRKFLHVQRSVLNLPAWFGARYESSDGLL